MNISIAFLCLAWSFFGVGKTEVENTEASAKVASIDTEKLLKEAVEKASSEAAEKAAQAIVDAKAEAEAAEKLRLEKKSDEEKLRLEKKADEEKLRLEAKSDAEKLKEERKEQMRQIETRIFRLNHASAEEVAKSFNEMWSGDFGVTWKIAKMAVAFPESNSVMVTAPRIILDACEKSIKALDVEAQQVYIEARFVELSNNASHKLGVDWQMLDGMKGSMKLGGGLRGTRLGNAVKNYTVNDDNISYNLDATSGGNGDIDYFNGTLDFSEMYLILRALEASQDARVFSNPKIIVSSGKLAKVDMTEKYPNVTISAKRTTSGSSDSLDLSMNMTAIPGEDKFMFAKEAFFSWGIELEVTPRISTNGLINVSIVPTISSQTDWVTAGASDMSKGEKANAGTYSSKYPVINVQRLITEFNMASGTTAVIGGLSKTTETQQDSGIPWLRDLWWIGPKLFGSKVRVKEQKEILVFVTVGLVNPREMKKDAGLPKNAVLGRQFTKGQRLEPGDRPQNALEGVASLDLRPLEEQAKDPLPPETESAGLIDFSKIPKPFTKEEKTVK